MKIARPMEAEWNHFLRVPERPTLDGLLPPELIDFPDPQRAIPAMAREPRQLSAIANLVAQLPTEHVLACCDAREISLPDNSVHLVVTSPPYWTLEKYRSVSGQLGDIADYEEFLSEPDRVWRLCLDSVG